MSAKGAPTTSTETATSPSTSSASSSSASSATATTATTKTATRTEESKPVAVEQPTASSSSVKIKSEPREAVDLTETESYKTLIEHEINDLLAEKLSQLILDNKLSIDELDDEAYGSIRKFSGNVEEGLSILNDFEQAGDEKLKDGRVHYLCELIKKSDERVNGETGETAASNASVTPNGESSASSTQSPAKSSTQQYQNSNSQQSQLEELKRKCDEISQRTGEFAIIRC